MNSKRIQSRKLFNYNIVLIGFMGTGKSTISEFLKNSFAMEVIEMDQIIAEREGMTISDIFEVYGEQYFRNLETNRTCSSSDCQTRNYSEPCQRQP